MTANLQKLARRSWCALLSCLGLLGIPACGNETIRRPAPIAADQYCERQAVEVCNFIARCCNDIGVGIDIAYCIQSRREPCAANLAAAREASLVYNPQVAGACFEELRRTLSTCSLAKASLEVLAAASPCDGVLQGTIALGEPCRDSEHCAQSLGGAACVADAATGFTCQERRPIGASCAGQSCVRGAVCDERLGECVAAPESSVDPDPLVHRTACEAIKPRPSGA